MVAKQGWEAYRDAPAAVHMHHGYRHGLLDHSTQVARIAACLVDKDVERSRGWGSTAMC